jgi:uncharacterized protein with PIN domain
MHLEKLIVILAVLLFFGLGIAILVIMDLSGKIPGKFQRDLFSIAGMRRDHPIEAFLTMTILLGIILALLGSLLAALMGQFGLFGKKEEPKLLTTLGEERMVEKMRHFHNAPEQHFTELGKKTVCFYCHGDYPHSKKPMIRTLMNMHTQFIGCMTCHADEAKLPEKDYRFNWLNFSGIPVKGVPFGTRLNLTTGQLIETDDYYSKIVVTTKNDTGGDNLLEMTEDKKDVQEFLAVRAKLNEQDREAIKKRFHKVVRPKGRKCSVCHTEEAKSYLPFRQLGFSDQRIVDITHLPFIGMLEKYNEFYMPNLLNPDNAAPAGDESSDAKNKTHDAR